MRHSFRVAAITAWILLPAAGRAAAPTHVFSQRFGDAASQSARALAVDLYGAIVMAGEFSGTVDFGDGPLTSAGDNDIFLARFDPDGSVQISRRFGDASGPQRAQAVAVDAGGAVILAGFFSSSVDFGGGALTSLGSNDVFIARFDPSLAHEWSRRFGDGDGQYASGVAVDDASNVYVTGYFSGTMDFGGGPLIAAGFDDVFLAKFTGAGGHLWSKRFGGTSSQQAFGVAVDPSGNVIIVGHFLGNIDFGGANLVGVHLDAFAAKFDPTGLHLWSKRFGSTLAQSVQAVTTDEAGNVYLAGTFSTSIDFGGGVLTSAGADDAFLAKLNPAGNHLWSKRFGDAAASQVVTTVAVDPTERVTIGGHFAGTADFGAGVLSSAGLEDLFVAQFQGGGTIEWSARYGDGAAQFVEALVADPLGDRVLAGNFAGAVDFGGGSLASEGAEDAFLARLDSWTLTSAPAPGIGSASLRAFPNPFNPATTLEASLPRSGPVTVAVHDAAGRRVALLYEGTLPAGTTALRWSGETGPGRPAPSGVYFARFEFPGGTIARKLVLLK
jgi:hypothetical protein